MKAYEIVFGLIVVVVAIVVCVFVTLVQKEGGGIGVITGSAQMRKQKKNSPESKANRTIAVLAGIGGVCIFLMNIFSAHAV